MTNSLNLEACRQAIELARPLMTKAKHKQFVHELRKAYVQGGIDAANHILSMRVCATTLRYQAQQDLNYWTAHMNKLVLIESSSTKPVNA